MYSGEGEDTESERREVEGGASYKAELTKRRKRKSKSRGTTNNYQPKNYDSDPGCGCIVFALIAFILFLLLFILFFFL